MIEVNTSPSFSSSSAFDKNIKTKVICDALTLIGLKAYDNHKYKQEQEKLSSNKNFKNAFKSKQASFGNFMSSSFKGSSGEEEVLQEFIDQQYRTGGFERIFPLNLNVHYYSQFFERPRINNELIKKYILAE